MDTFLVSRSYLETLSTADLINLADDYGIEIPPNLNRRFIIAELLEAAEDTDDGDKEDLLDDKHNFKYYDELPKSYNETHIGALMRNPVWAFVYWDIRTTDLQEITQTKSFLGLVLRVSFYTGESESPKDSFEISVSLDNREQYILLPAHEKLFRIDLIAEFGAMEPRMLAYTKKMPIPYGHPEISSTSLETKFSPILELSGLPELLRTHYNNHRQSFL